MPAAAAPNREDLLRCTKAFRSGWHELAKALVDCQKSQAYLQWGFPSFEEYYRKELRLKSPTVAKLVGSYTYLRQVAPDALQRNGVSEPLPTPEAVEYLRQTAERCGRGEVNDEVLDSMRQAVLEENLPLARIKERFRGALSTEADRRSEEVKKQRQAIKTATSLLQGFAALADAVPESVIRGAQEALAALIDAYKKGEERRVAAELALQAITDISDSDDDEDEDEQEPSDGFGSSLAERPSLFVKGSSLAAAVPEFQAAHISAAAKGAAP